MVLGWRRPGRVGRCRIPKKKLSLMAGLFLCPPGFFSRAVFSQVQHCTWLGYLLPAVENLAAVHLPAAADDVLNKGVKIQGNSSFAQLAGCAALLDTASGA